MQQSHEDRRLGTPDNLWQGVHGDLGASGRFDTIAKGTRLHLWAITHRGAILAALVGAIPALLFPAMQGLSP